MAVNDLTLILLVRLLSTKPSIVLPLYLVHYLCLILNRFHSLFRVKVLCCVFLPLLLGVRAGSVHKSIQEYLVVIVNLAPSFVLYRAISALVNKIFNLDRLWRPLNIP